MELKSSQMQYFQNFENEIKINIFKYVNYPLNLILTCRNWTIIAKDSYAKIEWLIENYGEENALFHAVRLGINFIDMMACQSLIGRNVITSKYFIQILLKNYKMYNNQLVQIRIEHNFNQFTTDNNHVFQQKIISSWARNLILFIFNHLLYVRQLSNDSSNDLPSNGMMLFFRINDSLLRNNYKEIEELMFKFVPKSSYQLDFKFFDIMQFSRYDIYSK
jgi:hypothetical protein